MRYILMIVVILLSSCAKDKCCELKTVENATIKWSGDVAADGCDWCILVDNKSYHPEKVLDTAFMHDGLNVKVSYELTDENFSCGWGAGMPVIHIVDISK